MKRQTIVLSTALAIAALTAIAGAQTQTAANAIPAVTPAAAPTAPSPDQQLRSEVEQLKQLIHDQQKRIDALEAGRTPEPAPPAVVASAQPVVTNGSPVTPSGVKEQDSTAAPQATTPQAPNHTT